MAAVSQLIGRGIGFSPGSVKHIITDGLGIHDPSGKVRIGDGPASIVRILASRSTNSRIKDEPTSRVRISVTL